MQKNLNLKVKYRESFRPFAPAVLREDVADWFEHASDSPYMLIVADVREDKRRQMTPDEAGLVRNRQAQCVALGNPGGDPCRLFGPHPDRARRHQSAVSPIAQPVQGADRLPDPGQHLASTFAANRSCARRKTPFAASWATNSTCSWSATAYCRKPSRTPHSKWTTSCHSMQIDVIPRSRECRHLRAATSCTDEIATIRALKRIPSPHEIEVTSVIGALFGPEWSSRRCPFTGVKRTSRLRAPISENDRPFLDLWAE